MYIFLLDLNDKLKLPFLERNKKNNTPQTDSQRETIRAYLNLLAVKVLREV